MEDPAHPSATIRQLPAHSQRIMNHSTMKSLNHYRVHIHPAMWIHAAGLRFNPPLCFWLLLLSIYYFFFYVSFFFFVLVTAQVRAILIPGTDPGRDSNPSEVSSGAGGCGEAEEAEAVDEDSGSLYMSVSVLLLAKAGRSWTRIRSWKRLQPLWSLIWSRRMRRRWRSWWSWRGFRIPGVWRCADGCVDLMAGS